MNETTLRTEDWLVLETDSEIDANRVADLKQDLADVFGHDPERIVILTHARLHVIRPMIEPTGRRQ